MKIKEEILKLAKERKKIRTPDLVLYFNKKFSRQYISRVISSLVQDNKLVKIGSTISAFYVLPENADEYLARWKIKKRLENKDLEEHEVLTDINNEFISNLKLEENIKSIFDYSFSEMLNNAIEHSDSKEIEIEVFIEGDKLKFIVNDFGVGVFRDVREKRGLKSELEAMQDLLKGKLTTKPQAHSGEGIFFTSKVAGELVLESYDYKLVIDNTIDDVFFGKLDSLKKGTRVVFSIPLKSDNHISEIFKYFQHDDTLGFTKTEIRVKLFTMGTMHVSRSQARRMLVGLDKFKVIILDFDQVPTIGQAFADEIFRIFLIKHLDIEIKIINANEAVRFMIDRVEGPNP